MKSLGPHSNRAAHGGREQEDVMRKIVPIMAVLALVGGSYGIAFADTYAPSAAGAAPNGTVKGGQQTNGYTGQDLNNRGLSQHVGFTSTSEPAPNGTVRGGQQTNGYTGQDLNNRALSRQAGFVSTSQPAPNGTVRDGQQTNGYTGQDLDNH
jgi:hypothetical protein